MFQEHAVVVAELIYIDETGSVGRGASKQPLLILVGLVVDEAAVQPLATRVHDLAMEHLGWIPAGFEWHGVDVWGGSRDWKGRAPAQLLAAFEAVIGLLEELSISVSFASIHKARLHDKYGGAFDDNAYLLALQFLLEKLDRWRSTSTLRILIADEAKQERLKAIELVQDLQQWTVGVVPGRKLVSIIDSIHFVESRHSPGVQLADMVAYVLQRSWTNPEQRHPDATSALARMQQAILDHTPTYRETWPARD